MAQVEDLKAALDTRPTRTQVAHEADAARKCSEAAAAERIQQLEQLTQTTTTACRAACSQVLELESVVRSEQTKRGLAATELQAAKTRLAAVGAQEQDNSQRCRERRQAERDRELDTARDEVERLKVRVLELEARAPLSKRGQAAPVVLQTIRTTDAPDAPFCGRTLEFMRRLVDECNGSFEGAATANAMILGLHIGPDVADSRLFGPDAFRRAFLRAGIADEEAAAKRNQADPGPWCIAQVRGSVGVVVYITLCHATLYHIIECSMRYCTTVLYCTVLYCTVLYCTVLYSTLLYSTLLRMRAVAR